jgi:hypothetical protein
MLELNIKCESTDEARVYLSAYQYLNLLTDLQAALRTAYKHGDDSDVLKAVEAFYPDIIAACDHAEGAY